MRRAIRFIAALVVGLGLLTWAASAAVRRTMDVWAERDVMLRAELGVAKARPALISHWSDDDPRLQSLLREVAGDEHIAAACACASDGKQLARTPTFPTGLSCAQMKRRIARDPTQVGGHAGASAEMGDWLASAVPVFDGDHELGFVFLVHDLTFVQRRERKVQEFLFTAFAVLAIAAAAVTALAARLSWRSWTNELRRFLRTGRGGASRAQFQPIMRDVRELVNRLVAEQEAEGEGGVWTPERLKGTLQRYLHGEKVVILANREPYVHEHTADGGVVVIHPASGLVTALEPIARACSGTWIAHGSGSADRETVDRHDRVRVPPGEKSYVIRRVWLTPEEEAGYYYGFCNEGLWPLCHIAHTRPVFRSEDWAYYQSVNRKFVDALCEEVDVEDPIVLVQDYHFALAPQLIRERLPRATVIMFWHIPWSNPESLGICPWRHELIRGMLGASILGFHTQQHCNNFLDSVDRFLETRIDRERNAVVQRGRSTLVRPYPISLEWPNHWAREAPPVDECRSEVLRALKLGPDMRLGVGVDRLDYTKGVEERLLAVERLLERYPEHQGRFAFVQLAAPSRTVIERYRHLNERVEETTTRINERFGSGDYRPIVLMRSHHEPQDVFRYYRAADLCYVSSLHDGMNLVAKEYVAARDDNRGVLILSEFTGAARELTEALVVNPYDLDQAADALAAALEMSPEEQRDRMRFMRAHVAEFNVYRWAGRMLADAARLRSHEQLSNRLNQHVGAGVGSRP